MVADGLERLKTFNPTLSSSCTSRDSQPAKSTKQFDSNLFAKLWLDAHYALTEETIALFSFILGHNNIFIWEALRKIPNILEEFREIGYSRLHRTTIDYSVVSTKKSAHFVWKKFDQKFVPIKEAKSSSLRMAFIRPTCLETSSWMLKPDRILFTLSKCATIARNVRPFWNLFWWFNWMVRQLYVDFKKFKIMF